MKSVKLVLTIMLFLLFISMSKTVMASCTASAQFKTVSTSGSFTVAKNQAPNTTIGSPVILKPEPQLPYPSISCTTKNVSYFISCFSGCVASEYADIYKTNVDGIGVKIKASSLIINNTPSVYNSTSHMASGTISVPYITLQFYVIGPVQTGDVNLSGITLRGWANTTSANITGAGFTYSISFKGTVEFKSGSCTTPNITVNLNKHAASDFASVGATSAPVPFNFEINNCDPGLTSVSYTFQPASGVTLQGSGNNQYLTLDSSSTASGVGVQVLYDDGITAVPFNTKTAFSGYNTSTGGSYTIPMKARYVRTGTISPGTANSAAEFVMAYE